MAIAGQKRCFMTPPVGAGLKVMFSSHFRGRGLRRKEQFMPSTGPASPHEHLQNHEVTTYGRAMRALKRMPDIDDPRPPIVGWQGQVSADGSLPIAPYHNNSTPGRKILQGLYKNFMEHYNQHYTFYPIYGGGSWCPRRQLSGRAFVHRSATMVGDVYTAHNAFIYPNTIIRGDLNQVRMGHNTAIMEGCVLTTDGHPRNVHLPGRVSRINEGQLKVGNWCIIHPNCIIDSAIISDYCEVGEGSKLGFNSIMEFGSTLEPGSVLLAHQRVPRFEIWAGNPARKVGMRDKNQNKWRSYIDTVLRYQAQGIFEEQQYRSNLVAATRSSEKYQDSYDRLVLQKQANLPQVIKDYIEEGTRDIPLWEEFKNVTRVNTRPGAKKGHDWTVDANQAKWVGHY